MMRHRCAYLATTRQGKEKRNEKEKIEKRKRGLKKGILTKKKKKNRE